MYFLEQGGHTRLPFRRRRPLMYFLEALDALAKRQGQPHVDPIEGACTESHDGLYDDSFKWEAEEGESACRLVDSSIYHVHTRGAWHELTIR